MPLFVLAMIAKTPDRSTVNWTPMEIGWNEGGKKRFQNPF